MKHQQHTNIQGRDQIRRHDQISAQHDSPNGGLRGLRERNQQLIEERERARERQAG